MDRTMAENIIELARRPEVVRFAMNDVAPPGNRRIVFSSEQSRRGFKVRHAGRQQQDLRTGAAFPETE